MIYEGQYSHQSINFNDQYFVCPPFILITASLQRIRLFLKLIENSKRYEFSFVLLNCFSQCFGIWNIFFLYLCIWDFLINIHLGSDLFFLQYYEWNLTRDIELHYAHILWNQFVLGMFHNRNCIIFINFFSPGCF